jgi:hypothetical protein
VSQIRGYQQESTDEAILQIPHVQLFSSVEASTSYLACLQVIQGFIHDDHEDLINNHVMMTRITDNI